MSQHLFFDMDGTLIDSMYFWNNLKLEMLESYYRRTGVRINADDEDNSKLESMSTKQAVNYFNAKYGCSLSNDLDIKKPLSDFYTTRCKAKDGVKEALEFFKSRGIKMAVMTATPRSAAKAALEKQGFSEYFDFIITPEDAKGGKFRKGIYYKACLKSRCLPKNAVLIDDAAYAIKTAKRVGYRAVAVYDQYRRDPAMQLGDLAFNDFYQLKQHFEKYGKF